MNHVFIHAFAAANLGDDLMMRILCTRYPKTKFLLYADLSYKQRFEDLANLTVYCPSDPWIKFLDKLLNKIKGTEKGFWKLLLRTAKATVHIGGSVFTQHETQYGPALNLDAQLCFFSKKLYVIGANFGPFEDENYHKDYQQLFKSYTDICFRDQYSFQLHNNLPNVRYAPDVVFNYKMDFSKKSKAQVLISMINLEHRTGKYDISQYQDGYEHFTLKIAQEFIKRGFEVLFVSFCSFQEDAKAVARIQANMTAEEAMKSDLLSYEQNAIACTQAFARSEVIIGTRFHSIILGWLARKRVLPIVYDNKTLHTLEDNHVENYLTLDCLGGKTSEDIERMTEDLLASTPFEPSLLIDKATQQFAGLDKLLM